MKQTLNAISIALYNVRNRFFHTLLSLIGIVVGVAALVGTLSLIDGMEKYANDQISGTTSVNSMTIRSVTSETVDGISVAKKAVSVIDFDDYEQLRKEIPFQVNTLIQQSGQGVIKVADTNGDTLKLGTKLHALAIHWEKEEHPIELMHGRSLSPQDQREKAWVCLINEKLAKRITKDSTTENAIGKKVFSEKGNFKIVGVIKNKKGARFSLGFPISVLSGQALKKNPATLYVQAASVEEVNPIKGFIENWLEEKYPEGKKGFGVTTNASRVAQAEQGFLIFRVVMGLIVGLSVLVGGIGVMNVMLISVNERTSEIGISKALGAKRKDIFIQFLSESVTISALGSSLGLLLGILATLVFVPVIKHLTKVPFQAEYTFNMLFIIGMVALAVGVIFGTYPATRAAKLDPVEAMRRE